MAESKYSLKEELLRIISDECAVYEKLLILMKEKTDILVKNDVNALRKNTESVNQLLSDLEDLEAKRKEAVLGISQEEQISPEELTITKLTRLWPETPLEQLQNRLQAAMTELKKINERNQKLVNQAQDLFSFMRNLFYSAFAQGPTTGYTSEGKIDQPKGGYFEKEI